MEEEGGFNEKKRQKIEIKNWADLDEEPLKLIIKKLWFLDQVRSSLVCKNWHAKAKRIGPSCSLPWLFSYNWIKKKPYQTITLETLLHDPFSQKSYRVRKSMWQSGMIFGGDAEPVFSKNGWVLFVKKLSHDTTFFSYNPFANRVIRLPSLKQDIDVAIFAGNPCSPDCLFFVSYRDRGKVCIGTCKLDDKNWITWMVDLDFNKRMASAVYSEEKGEFYCLFNGGILASISFSEKSSISTILLAKCPGIEEYQNYLVEYDGQLLLVVGSFRLTVLRFDWNQMNWIDQDSLGNGAIFLNSTGFCASAVSAVDAIGLEDNICFGDQRYFEMNTRENYFSKAHYSLADWTFGRRFWIQLPPFIAN
ncbi:hypothetical protein ACH5RR_023045 [Cinchona calisaya]|uniref:F-box domain-containing protein n=1 Tax=Cinchona calisaya TaxID=153742 RepID=A0ABD2ZAK8_9GENT